MPQRALDSATVESVDVRGIRLARDDAAHRKVGGIVLPAMEELGYRSSDLPLVVQPDPHGRPNVEAFSSQGGISVTPELLVDPDPGRPVWVLSEEVGHRYLNEIFGIPHGGDFLNRFAQEAFGSWFQCHRMLRPGLYSPEAISTEPIEEHIPSPDLGLVLGKHAGSSVAGSYKSAERLEEWYASPLGDPAFKARVRDAIEGFQAGDSPEAVAREITRLHSAARASGC